jgi:hypothetical protein
VVRFDNLSANDSRLIASGLLCRIGPRDVKEHRVQATEDCNYLRNPSAN